MRRFFIISSVFVFGFISCFGQSDFKRYVDANAKKLPYDDYTLSVLIMNIENKMQTNLGWTDKVVWTKGIAQNYIVGAIDGKCGSKKGEIFYFRTIIKEVDGEILWDEESFSDKVRKLAIETKINRKHNVKIYTEKLRFFEDSLVNYYSNKYDSIYLQQINDYDSLLIKYGDIGNEYRYNDMHMSFKFDHMSDMKESAKDEIEDIIFPINMYTIDFENSENSAEYYETICNKAIKEANDIDTCTMSQFFDNNEYQVYLQSIDNELLKKKVAQDSINHIKMIEEKILSIRTNIENRIMQLLEKINDGNYKKTIKKLYAKGTEEQKEFMKVHLKSISYEQVLSEYQVYGSVYVTYFRTDAIFHKPDNQSKLDRMKYWDRNLSYWEKGLK